MQAKELRRKYNDYSRAVSRLHEILQLEANEYIYDATIQRFEFTYELAWKLLQAHLRDIGIAEVNSPRDAFKEAFAAGLISDGEKWIDILRDRNLTAHTYDEAQARIIYNRIKEEYIFLFLALRDRLEGEIVQCDLD